VSTDDRTKGRSRKQRQQPEQESEQQQPQSADAAPPVAPPAPEPEPAFAESPEDDDIITGYVYVILIKRFVSLATLTMYDKSQFDDLHFGKVQKHGGGTVPASLHFMESKTARKVKRLTYRPGARQLHHEGGLSALNTYRPSALRRTSGDPKPWLALVNHIFPDEGPRAHFLAWAAHHVRRPDIKINHAVFLASKSGIGKDSMLDPIIAATGDHNTGIITQLDLDTDQNDYLLNRRLIIGQELMATKNWRTLANKLKPYLAAPPHEIRVNRKNVPQFEVPNIANWIFLTNSETPIAIEEDDRRFFFYWSPAAPLEVEFYKAYHIWAKDHAGDVLGYLLDYDIESFNPKARPPMTAAKAALIEDSKSDIEQFLKRKIDEQSAPFDEDLFTMGHVLNDLPQRLRCSEQRLGRVLRKLGAKHLRQAVRRTGLDTVTRPHVWAIRNAETYVNLRRPSLASC
jgi:hypothetical protein